MKKIIAMAICGLTIITHTSMADTYVSVNYDLSTLYFSKKSNKTNSILTWRDILLHGAWLNADFAAAPFNFDRANIGIRYSMSTRGYHTDDDANNSENRIGTADVNVSLLNLSYEVRNENDKFNPFIGLDFNCLWLENHTSKYFSDNGINLSEGIIGKYDDYKLGFYGGFQTKLGTDVFYLNISGQIGFVGYFAVANWIRNMRFNHPDSFYDLGLSFRTSGEIDVCFNPGRVSFFTKMRLLYEISPGLGLNIQRHSDGGSAWQSVFSEYSKASLGIGVKVSF